MKMIAKFLRSVIRTIVAGGIIILALIGIAILFLWRPLAQDNYFRWLIIVPCGAISIVLFFLGIYLISPIFWRWMKHKIDRTDWASYVIDTYEVKRKYIW